MLTSGADKPEQHPDKVEPNPNLHPAAAFIVAAVAVDVHFTEDTEQGSPEDAVGNTPNISTKPHTPLQQFHSQKYRVPKEKLEGSNKR